MDKPRMEPGVEQEANDDLAGLTDEQIAREQQLFAERAERVRWRLERNVPVSSKKANEPTTDDLPGAKEL